MIKTILFIFAISYSVVSWAQHKLNETDTSLHYYETFYEKGELKLVSLYKCFDSLKNQLYTISKEQFDLNVDNIDIARILLQKHGTWKIEYENNGKKYYYLANYRDDLLIGKRYDFNSKGKLISTFTRYPKIKDSVYHGSQIIEYDKRGKIKLIRYIQFDEDRSQLSYWYWLSYYSDGTLKYYSFEDEANNMSRFIWYSKKGEITRDYKRDALEWYDRKWNRRKTLLKEELHLDKKRIRRTYRNGRLIKERTK